MNTKELKLQVKTENYPDALLKNMDMVLNRIGKEHRSIPKSVGDWKKELSGIRYAYGEIEAKIKSKEKLMTSLQEKIKTAEAGAVESIQNQIDKTSLSLDNLNKKLEKQTMMARAVSANMYTPGFADKNKGGFGDASSISNLIGGGALGAGAASLIGGMGPVGMGIAAIASVLAIAYKAFDTVQESAEQGRAYYTESLSLNRKSNLRYDSATAYQGLGAKYNFSNEQMLSIAQSVEATTGRFLISNPAVLASVAKMIRVEGLTEDVVSAVSKAGVGAGLVKSGGGGIEQYFSLYVSAMEKGLDLGFNKNERISQIVKLQQITAKEEGLTNEGFKRTLAQLRVLERTGLVGLRGDKAISMIEKASGILRPSEQTTPLFASLMMSGIIPEKYKKEAISNTGISKEMYNNLLPADQFAMIQDSVERSGKSIDMFRDIYKNLERSVGGLAPSMMSRLYNVSLSDTPKFMRNLVQPTMQGKFSQTEFNKALAELSDTTKNNVESELGLKVEFSNYLKGQYELTKSIMALKSSIDLEIEGRKLKLAGAEAVNNLFKQDVGISMGELKEKGHDAFNVSSNKPRALQYPEVSTEKRLSIDINVKSASSETLSSLANKGMVVDKSALQSVLEQHQSTWLVEKPVVPQTQNSAVRP